MMEGKGFAEKWLWKRQVVENRDEEEDHKEEKDEAAEERDNAEWAEVSSR